jgi:hypothetical protein
MTGTNCDLFTHNQSRSYLNHLVYIYIFFFWFVMLLYFVLPVKWGYCRGFSCMWISAWNTWAHLVSDSYSKLC